MPRRALAICLLLAWLAHPRAASAQATGSSHLRVHLRVESESDARLLERVRGQTSDLALALEAYAPSAPLGSFGAAVAQAFAHCKQSGADVVVWALEGRADPAGGAESSIVALATCRDDRVFARRIESVRPALGASDAARSGALELAALVLRGALSVLAQGGTLGVVAPTSGAGAEQSSQWDPSAASTAREGTTFQSSTAAMPGAAAPPAPDATRDESPAREAPTRDSAGPEPEPAPSAPSKSRRGVAALALLGVQQTWDGGSAAGQPALSALVALGRARFRLGIIGSFGFEIEHENRYATLAIGRHTIAGAWRQLLWQRRTWSLSAGLDAGAVFYRRATSAQNGATRARPPALSPAGFASPWVGLGRRFEPLSISLSAALDVLPFVPSFVYRTALGTREAHEIWPVAPRLVLAFGIDKL